PRAAYPPRAERQDLSCPAGRGAVLQSGGARVAGEHGGLLATWRRPGPRPLRPRCLATELRGTTAMSQDAACDPPDLDGVTPHPPPAGRADRREGRRVVGDGHGPVGLRG